MGRRSLRELAPLLALLAVVAALYAQTFTDAIQVADSGELVAVACNGGVAHPPGYPLYTLLGRGLCALPVSTPAGRLSLLSAGAGLLSVLLAWALVARLTGSRRAALVAAAALATGWLFWRHASLPEVFALHAALCLLLCWTSVFAAQAASARAHLARSALVGLAGGLALSNHHSAVWLAPLAAAAVLFPARGALALVGRAGAALAGIAAGLLPYLHLLLADRAARPRWGDTAELGGLLHHVARRDYGTLKLAIEGEGRGLDVMAHFVAELPAQLGGPLVVAAAAGLALLVARAAGRSAPATAGIRRDLAALLALSPLLAGPAFFLLFNLPADGIERQVVERFFLMPIALLAIPLGVGVAWAEARLVAAPRRGLAAVALLAVVAATASLHHRRADVSESYAVEDYGLNVLATAEPGALVLGSGDARLFSITYAQEVLGIGRDVQYVDVWLLLYRWYADQQLERHPELPYEFSPGNVDSLGLIARSLAAGRPVYLANPYSERAGALPSYPVGSLRRLVSPGERLPPPRRVLEENLALEPRLLRRGRPPDPALDPWSADLYRAAARPWIILARIHAAAGDPALAEAAAERARAWGVAPF